MSDTENNAEVLPYKTDYAKSGRANCKACKSAIEKGSLRLAAMVKSPMFDSMVPHWYHFMCFFGKQRPKCVGDIEHFENLRWSDQEKIRKNIENLPTTSDNGVAKKATKRGKAAAAKGVGKVNFLVEYSKSSRAACRGCGEKIIKDEVRISKKDFDSDEGRRYGGIDRWHHSECFVKLRSELEFLECGDTLPGFNTLKKDDQNTLRNLLPPVKVKTEPTDAVDGEEVVSAKKIKIEGESSNSKADDNDEALLKAQNKRIFKMRDLLKRASEAKRKLLQDLLEYNSQEMPAGVDRLLDKLADVMTFGALLPCKECNGHFVYKSGVGYVCHGTTEWVRCENVTQKPDRKPFKIPDAIAESVPELAKYKCKVGDRIIQKMAHSSSSQVKKEDETDSGPKVKSGRSYPLNGMEFYIYGLESDKKNLKTTIERYGGKVVSKAHNDVTAVISTQDGIDKMKRNMKDMLESCGIQVVPKDFLERCSKGDPCETIMEMNLCEWGVNPFKRIQKTLAEKEKSTAMKSGKSKFMKSGSSKVTLKVQSGSAVDPDSGLQNEAHVYGENGGIYSVVLGLVDIQRDVNKYYKMQILQSNTNKSRFWLFRAWGRVGTTIGGTKLDTHSSLHAAETQFSTLFEERTGNIWELGRKYYDKIPGKMYILDLDYGDKKQEVQMAALTAADSKLSKPVQELLMMLFDIDLMKKTMLEFELDLEKMPLGKISEAQIRQAYSILSELQSFLEKTGSDVKVSKRSLLLEASNRFYTLIPHDFGIKTPPLLDSIDLIKTKMEMLDSLLEMEVAFNFLSSGGESGDKSLDKHYDRLNADIEVLERECHEFGFLQQYVTNTHAATHQQYKLEIMEAFKVCRKEEVKRYKPFQKLPNRKLLWHGSRLTNFAGILSQGLRIAPPEAPTTGYMFGKGIYFADMVSKSANYCLTSPGNNVGLMLLCEVALGNMYERRHADYIEKLPSGHHSCKGVGNTGPDPTGSIHHDGIEIPAGKPVKATDGQTSLLYNEYIVYDVAQVKAKYLLKMNFKYNY